jgi:hypothetical protein
MVPVDKQHACRWRYQELRWLGGSILPEQLRNGSGSTYATDHGSFFSTLAQDFVNSSARFLIDHDAAKTHSSIKHLGNLFLNASQIGLMVWRQPLEVEVRGFDQLRGQKFSSDDTDVEVKVHSFQLGDEEPQDNANMELVVQPSIVVLPEPGMEKVWAQAIVLWQ